MGNELERAGQRASRPVYVYEVPENVGGDVTVVGLVELTAEEEVLATKRAKNDPIRLAYELAKQCLVEVNGQPVKLADGSADTAWGKMNPKVRNLVLSAYAELHSPPEGAAEDFLRSRQVRVA